MALDRNSYIIPVARTVQDLRETVDSWRREGQSIALVPTMGALHKGHLSLIDAASIHASKIVVSIFVNPTQFAPHEDFDDYPRTEASDADVLRSTPTDLIYAPSSAAMYASDFSTSISVADVSDGLCSSTRPHFFGGVAIVVAKLLLQALPDIAVFGEKDYQQLMVIRRMVRDLDIPVEILAAATAREKDGLAISSRNTYLTKDERSRAPILIKTLKQAAQDIRQGATVSKALEVAKISLNTHGFDPVDYVDLRHAETLAPLEIWQDPARLLAAATLGKTRLIDNIAV